MGDIGVEVQGSVARGFEPVAEEFARNFESRGDVAASCAAYRHGERVVDLWAGATPRGPWTPDLRTVLFSVSKGVTTIALLMAVERGDLALDERVATYWPEYGVRGKEATTVRHVLAHRAGLPAVDAALTLDEVVAWTPVAEALAAQAPRWEPGAAFQYHSVTFGTLAGEILRRATGLRPHAWIQRHIAGPLGVTLGYGVDPGAQDFVPLLPEIPIQPADAPQRPVTELEIRANAFGGAFDPADLFGSIHRPRALAAELPGANLVGNARGIAAVYAATVGEIDGVRLVGDELLADVIRPHSEGPGFDGVDPIARWGTGFMIDHPRRRMAGPGSFGHDGAGGQLSFAHRELGVAFAYQTARPSRDPQDDRAEAVSRAFRSLVAPRG